MQAVMETTFDLVYLISVITIGILMVRASSGKSRQFTIFGWMAIILGGGDSFHLIPRVIALCTTGLDHYTAVLGVGKVVTSVTMTIFYVLLYYVWRERYQIRQHRSLTGIVYLLAAARIVLCLLPQNQWTAENPPEGWGMEYPICPARCGCHHPVLPKRKGETGSCVPPSVADDRAELRFLHPGCPVCVKNTADGYADDPEDLRLYVDRADRI